MLKVLVKFISFFFRKNDKKIIYTSFPDFSDNSFAMFCYVANHQLAYKNIWLVNSVKHVGSYKKLARNYTASDNFKIIKKKSLLGFYHFLTSKFVFHTHGIYNNFPLLKKQVNINLWHGMPLKNIGYLDGKTDFLKTDYVIATATIFKDIMARVFDINKEKVLLLGQPRNQFLLEPKATLNKLFGKKSQENSTTILWMPTYRKSNFGEVRDDGKVLEDGLMSNENLIAINDFLTKANATCFIKLHPMDANSVKSFNKYSNIIFIDNTSFNDQNLNMYSCFASVDILLTDYSSIYIDFLILNKPIGFVVNDFKSYSDSRGFTLTNPLEYMPGKIIYDNKDLIEFLNTTIVLKNDEYVDKRTKINLAFNEVYKKSSERIFNTVILEKSELN